MACKHLYGLVYSNLHTLDSAIGLLDELSTEQYTKLHTPLFESSIGKHLRHIIDHYLCFQRDFTSGLIDYNCRERDSQLETNRQYAHDVLCQVKVFMASFQAYIAVNQPLQVIPVSYTHLTLPTIYSV